MIRCAIWNICLRRSKVKQAPHLVFSKPCSFHIVLSLESWWLSKDKYVSVLVRESLETHRCLTDYHDMTLTVKIALNSNTNKQKANCKYCFFPEKWRFRKEYIAQFILLPQYFLLYLSVSINNYTLICWRLSCSSIVNIQKSNQRHCWFNLFPNKRWFLHVCSTSLLKTLYKKEKSLVKSNFSFSCGVFYPFWELFAISIKFEIVSANSFSLEESTILSPGIGLKEVVIIWT